MKLSQIPEKQLDVRLEVYQKKSICNIEQIPY